MRIFLVVKSFVPSHLKKDFDDWYEKEHLFEAKQTFSAISASRGWQIQNKDIHCAYYEFDNLKKANKILKSEALNKMINLLEDIIGKKALRDALPLWLQVVFSVTAGKLYLLAINFIVTIKLTPTKTPGTIPAKNNAATLSPITYA